MKDLFEPRERHRKNPLRGIVNVLLYITKTGCQWRMLPGDFALQQTVYFYFEQMETRRRFWRAHVSVKRLGNPMAESLRFLVS